METMFKKTIFVVFVGVSGVLWVTSLTAGQTSIIAEIQKLQPAIVSIKAVNKELFQAPYQAAALDKASGRIMVMRRLKAAGYNRFGAGVVIHPSGIVVTNAHVVNNADHIQVVLHDDTEIPAEVLLVVKNLDIGLIRIPLPYPITPVELADSDRVKLRDEVINIGNSQFLKQTFSGGRIKGIGTSRRQFLNGEIRTANLLQTTINLYEGDSGGPLFDQAGRLIGMMTAKEVAADHSSFAVPANLIQRYLSEYLLKNTRGVVEHHEPAK